ncbi:hypothetical protein F2Q69_00030128 [Brassica cretica]|uniref:Uncharacterized protein n=1 Tax=Brassica cretica TaxID=69181 RepID=A0A8S9S6Q8_BRACR|nr:hypothetical protein F2Q69_00030128 [Brassica cretica]
MPYHEHGVLSCGSHEEKSDEEEDNDCLFKERRAWPSDERERVGWAMETHEPKRNKIKKRRIYTRPLQNKNTKSNNRGAKSEGEAQVEEEKPRNRRRVQVILARPSSSSDVEEDSKVRDSHERSNKRPTENGRPEESNDLRNKLRRKSQTIDHVHDSKNDLRSIIEESKAKRVEDSSVQPQLKPRVPDLRDQLNSKSEDLRIKLNRPNRSDLR